MSNTTHQNDDLELLRQSVVNNNTEDFYQHLRNVRLSFNNNSEAFFSAIRCERWDMLNAMLPFAYSQNLKWAVLICSHEKRPEALERVIQYIFTKDDNQKKYITRIFGEALELACQNKDLTCFHILLSNGADATYNKNHALKTAIKHQCDEMVNILYPLSSQDPQHTSELAHLCIEHGYPHILRAIIQNTKFLCYHPFLTTACEKNDPQSFQLLLPLIKNDDHLDEALMRSAISKNDDMLISLFPLCSEQTIQEGRKLISRMYKNDAFAFFDRTLKIWKDACEIKNNLETSLDTPKNVSKKNSKRKI